jgi:putative oxidoreductase
MKKTSFAYRQIVCFLLILLWVYSAASKLMNFKEFEVQLRLQTLPSGLKGILVYALPLTELIAAALLFIPRYRQAGFYASFILLTLFSAYIGLILSHAFGRVPCSCGGILSHLPWGIHLIFNSCCLFITIIAIYLKRKGET